MTCKLIHGDCLQVLKDIEDNSIDLVLADPPYGTTAEKWDNQIDITTLWPLLHSVLKTESTCLMFTSQPYTTKVINSNQKNFRYCWYWIKNQGTNFFHAKRMPIRKVEEICVFGKGKYNPQITHNHVPTNSAKGVSKGRTYSGLNKRSEEGGKTTRFPINVLEFSCVNNYSRLHSSEKPVDLMEYLIKTYTNEGDTVLDFCAGSGTTGVAANNLNRNCILIEKEEKYIEVIKNRIPDISIS